MAVFALVWVEPAAGDGATVAFGGAATDAPESLAKPTVVVRLSTAITVDVSVSFRITGGTATRGATAAAPTDYMIADGTLTFPAGTTVKTLPIEVVDDDTPEEPETVLLELSDPQNAALGAQSTHTFTIRDNDAVTAPLVEFAATASAGDESMGTAKLVVVVAPNSTDEVSVDYSVTGGSATNGSDFALDAGTLTFQPGETTKIISLSVVDDADVEESETVTVRLSNAQGATLGYKEEHTFTILDNDKPPEVFVSFQAAQSVVREDVGTYQISVVITGGPPHRQCVGDLGCRGRLRTRGRSRLLGQSRYAHLRSG